MLRIYALNLQQQKSLIDYLFGICDTLSFVIQNFNHAQNNNQNILLNDYGEYDDYCCLHNKNTLKLIKKLNLSVIRTCNSSQYGSQNYNYQSKIFFVKTNDNLKIFLSNHLLEEWRFPDLPEDLIFYQDNNIWLETVTHEHIIWIHNERKEDIAFLNKHKIKFHYED